MTISIIPIKVIKRLGVIVDIEPDGETITEKEINRAIFAIRRLIVQKRSFGVVVE